MLSIYLYNEVDNRRYKDLKAYFEKDEPDLKEFQQVTRKFTDVFKVPQKIYLLMLQQFKRKIIQLL